MKETEKRISEYRKALPRLKEKVLAAALMLVVSVVTMTASTFAWLTISRKPEVSGVATTISGNGNLEIALSDFDGLEPEESEVGDSGKNIIAKNITWGNLVNLSNEQYGLKNLTLRPATLNETALATNPLRAAVYGADGRVSATTADFAFTIFDGKSAFKVPETTEYGVKAISSVGYTYPGGQGIFDMRVERASRLLSQAQDSFKSLCSTGNITAISGVIGEYASCKMVDRLKDDGSVSLPSKDFGSYMSEMYKLMGMLNDNYQEILDAAAALASIQLPVAQADLSASALILPENDIVEMDKIVDARMAATAEDAEMVLTTSDVNALMEVVNAHVSNLKNNLGIEINGFNQFLYDYYFNNRYLDELGEISAVADSEFIGWTRISHIINFVVDVPTTEVEGHAVKNVGLSAAKDIYGNMNNAKVVIKKGAIKNLEQFIGQKIEIKGVKVTVDISGAKGSSLYNTAKLVLRTDRIVATGNISTEVTASMYQMPKQLQELQSGSADSSTKVPIAQDTYGMAIDIWLRTNMENCYLTLEGNILTKQEQKTDDFGNLYFKHKESGVEYYKDKDGVYYDLSGKEAEDIDPANDLEIVWIDIVIGYEGENRIWDEDTLSSSSMTQGSGSCYVFYADSPTEQAQSLELMKAMKVAFIDDEGTLLAVANMDADSHYAEGGRVIVPLLLDDEESIKAGEDVMGNPIYAITKLDRGVSTRITALIYIDGYNLDNKQVLSADIIQGQLNIQFGTSAEMVPAKDEDLYQKELNITAEVTPTQHTFGDSVPDESTVKLIIGGYTPSEVKASFVRQINSSQGTKQDEIAFIGSGANWEGKAVFTAPGTYILRTVWLDGIEYTLKEPQTVRIDGYSLNSIRIDGVTDRITTVRTTDSSFTKDVYLQFAGDWKPDTVQVLFMNEDNQSMLVDCDWDGVNWSGKVTFPTSGTYHMLYYLVDGEYYEISESLQKTLILQLGLKVNVTVLPRPIFTFVYGNEDDQKEANSVELQVRITDNNGVELKDFDEVNITYKPTTAANASGNKLYAELTWNEYGYYEGKVQAGKPGAYEFYNMFIDGSYITSGSSPVIRAVPPEPPTYEGSLLTEDYIFTVNQEAQIGASIAYSNGTEVQAVFTKIEGEGAGVIKTVTGSAKTHIDPETGKEEDTIIDWYFAVPKDTDTADNGAAIVQQGKWKITELLISDVIIDGVEYTTEEPLHWDMSLKTDLTLEVANDVVIEVISTGATPFNSTTNTGINQGTFLSSYSADLQIKMYTYKGGKAVAIPGLSDVKLAYRFDYSDYATGTQYYADTTAVDAAVSAPQQFTLSDTDGDFIYTMNASINMPYAGKYALSYFGYKIGDVAYAYRIEGEGEERWINKPNGMPEYKVNWTTPTVKIVGTNPTAGTGFTGYKSGTIIIRTETVKNEFNDYECTVYIKRNGTLSWSPSSVKLEMNGAGTKYSSAEMRFKSPNGEKYDTTFTFASSSTGTAQKSAEWGNGGMGREPAGTSKSNELIMYGTVDGKTIEFLFKVTDITLNNPK